MSKIIVLFFLLVALTFGALAQPKKATQAEAIRLVNLANSQVKLKKFDAARINYGKAAKILLELKQPKPAFDIANLLIGFGNNFYQAEKFARAIAFYETALPIVKAVDSKQAMGFLYVGLGTCYKNTGNKNKSIENYKLALPISLAENDQTDVKRILTDVVDLYVLDGEDAKALESLQQVVTFYEKAGNQENLVSMLDFAGATCDQINQKPKAIEYFMQALEIIKTTGDKVKEAKLLNIIARIYNFSGEKQKALDYFNEGLKLSQSIGDRSGEVRALANLGFVYDSISEDQKALEYYNLALPIRKELKDKNGEAETLNNIGKVYLDLGDYQKAISFFNPSLLLYRLVEDKNGEAAVLNNFGLAYYKNGDYQKSLDYYFQALNFIKLNDNRLQESIFLNNIGSAFIGLQNYPKAQDYFAQALKIAQAIGDKGQEATTLANIGTSFGLSGNQAKAVEYFSQTLLICRAINDSSGEAQVLNNLMVAWSEIEPNGIVATVYGKQSVNVYQQLRAKIKGLDKAVQQSYIETVKDSYRTLSDILIQQGRILEAQQVLDLLKDNEFAALRSSDKSALVPYSSSELSTLKILDQLAGLGSERANLLTRKASLTVAENQRLSQVEAAIAKANGALRVSLEAIAKIAGAGNLVEIKEAKAMQSDLRELGQGTVAIYTLVVPEDNPLEDKTAAAKKDAPKAKTGWIILVTPDFRKAYPIDITDLNEVVFGLREALRSDLYDPQPLAFELYKKLFRQTSDKQKTTLEQDLNEYLKTAPNKTLMWSLDGVLRYIPMNALHDGTSYLIEKYRNTVFTPASKSRLKDVPVSDQSILGFGVSEAKEGFSALPGVKRELESIIGDEKLKTKGILNGSIYLDQEFTKEAMINGLRKGVPIIHFATHFSYQTSAPESSFLLLGDGHLPISEMQDYPDIFANTDLVTLSACDTATSQTDNGKEMEGLGYTVQSLGAKSIIASLWQVSDLGTGELMTRFYQLRKEKADLQKIETLRQAQISMLKGEITETGSKEIRSDVIDLSDNKYKLTPYKKDEKKPFAHPFYWSPFILIGNWR